MYTRPTCMSLALCGIHRRTRSFRSWMGWKLRIDSRIYARDEWGDCLLVVLVANSVARYFMIHPKQRKVSSGYTTPNCSWVLFGITIYSLHRWWCMIYARRVSIYHLCIKYVVKINEQCTWQKVSTIWPSFDLVCIWSRGIFYWLAIEYTSHTNQQRVRGRDWLFVFVHHVCTKYRCSCITAKCIEW